MTGTFTIRYRSPTPLYTDLQLAGRTDRIDGRKVFASGHAARRGDRLCAEAEGIFISVDRDRFVEHTVKHGGPARECERERSGSDRAVSERRVASAGPVNFRDVGGYPTSDGRTVAWRRLYRSDSLHHLEPDDGPLLRERGIVTAIDFRADDELDRIGIGRLGELDIRHVHLPTVDRALHTVRPPDWDPPESAAEVYVIMMRSGGRAYAAALARARRAGRAAGGVLLHGRQGPDGSVLRGRARPARRVRRRHRRRLHPDARRRPHDPRARPARLPRCGGPVAGAPRRPGRRGRAVDGRDDHARCATSTGRGAATRRRSVSSRASSSGSETHCSTKELRDDDVRPPAPQLLVGCRRQRACSTESSRWPPPARTGASRRSG